jgi:formamidopyrimidine-DNA glycosylase
MPELPEVEVTRRGVAPHVEGQVVTDVVLRHAGLRWPFPNDLAGTLRHQHVRRTARRGKYLLLEFDHGTLIVHLGMSGHLRILPNPTPPEKHDHFDLVVGQQLMRLTDPRRFGAVLWHGLDEGDVSGHMLLRGLGVEPLEQGFSAQLLYRQTRNRAAPIKQVLLAGDIVVGVGNIYASESLFRAGINPKTPARRMRGMAGPRGRRRNNSAGNSRPGHWHRRNPAAYCHPAGWQLPGFHELQSPAFHTGPG